MLTLTFVARCRHADSRRRRARVRPRCTTERPMDSVPRLCRPRRSHVHAASDLGTRVPKRAGRTQKQRCAGRQTPVTSHATVASPSTPVRGRALMPGNTAFSLQCGSRKKANGVGFLTADTPSRSRLWRGRTPSFVKLRVEAGHRVPPSWLPLRQSEGRAAWRLTISAAAIQMIGR